MKIRLIGLSLIVLGLSLSATPAHAQRRFAPTSRRGGAPARAAVWRRAGAYGGGGYFAGPGYDPYLYYSDYNSGPGMMMMAYPPPQIVVEQAAPPTPAASASNAHDSLVLELQGDHWVRLTNHGQSQTEAQAGQLDSERVSNAPSPMPPASPRRPQAQEPPVALPPAVLAFRDGHREEIGKYSIIGAVIYANADYWTTGSWTRYIPIGELDVPATLKLNQERGANFRLPSGPNEVIFRP
jgi:hypothetical protein